MTAENVVIGGGIEAANALSDALGKLGVQTRILAAAGGLAEALVSMERELSAQSPGAAVSVGTGDAALALAITASKLGIPLAVSLDDSKVGEADDRHRILATLASLNAGPDAARAADLIAAWLREESPAPNLESDV